MVLLQKSPDFFVWTSIIYDGFGVNRYIVPYDYSKVSYSKVTDKVCIICPKHGDFWQEARQHYRGQGCPKCGINERAEKRTDTAEEFIKKAKEVHGNKYNYSKVNYINSQTKVCIICPEHGEFFIKPNGHIQGQ